MALARTPPDEAQKSWALWYKAARLVRLPTFLRSRTLAYFVFTTFGISLAFFLYSSGRTAGIERASRDLRKEYDAYIQAINAQLASAGATQSRALKLNDSARWRISNNLRELTIDRQTAKQNCQMRVHSKPGTDMTVWQEHVPILKAAGWQISGGKTAKTFFPEGITIFATHSAGYAYNCAYRYYEMLQSLKINPISLVPASSSPDLSDCGVGNCIEVVIGEIRVNDSRP